MINEKISEIYSLEISVENAEGLAKQVKCYCSIRYQI